MAVKIGHASIDERGKISGGKVGDQTGKEICIRDWYKKDWNVVLICTDEKLADMAASLMEQICKDDNYGYDQLQRLTGYQNIVKNGGKVKGAKGGFDCSSLISAVYKLAGLDISTSCTTRNLKAALKATGKFEVHTGKTYLNSDAYAQRGAVYINEGHHTVMALGDGSKSKKKQAAGSSETTKKETGYKVRVTAKSGLNVRTGPGKSYGKARSAYACGTKHTITSVKNGWGKTKDGWICLKYTEKV